MEGAAANTISSALSEVGTIVTQCINIITGNTVLFVIFAGGLLGIGFKAIRQAKKSAK